MHDHATPDYEGNGNNDVPAEDSTSDGGIYSNHVR